MVQRSWCITGVCSGCGLGLTALLLERGDRVVGTVCDQGKVADLLARPGQQRRSIHIKCNLTRTGTML